jgi:hypothetical protein
MEMRGTQSYFGQGFHSIYLHFSIVVKLCLRKRGKEYRKLIVTLPEFHKISIIF